MAYVPVPKDLNAVKTKAMFNLTKRQLICFGSGLVLAVPLFFILKAHINISGAAIIMIIVLLPFMLLAMYEKNGQPFEKVAKNIINVLFIRPKQRPYKTNNYYSLLEKQDKLNKEVERIVKKGK
ncbi:MAG: PrgI family protein [Acutalibacteraceae bacterium]|nr:PrgI family protein [Acutalibacteraceae bacterium]